jgi:nicotinamide-nucleotide amidase
METDLQVEAGLWLRKRGLKLATAESCTGGLIGHLITEVPGSSDYYIGGVVSYAYEAKVALLGVPPGMLAMYGAVSRETALEMARGVRRVLAVGCPEDSMIGLSVTGVAGPGGGTPTKPLGLTWISLSAVDFQGAWSFVWQGSRSANKLFSAQEALRLLLEYLKGQPRREGL